MAVMNLVRDRATSLFFNDDEHTFNCRYAMIQNAGNTIITTNKGWTIFPMQVIHLGSYQSEELYMEKLAFKFGATNVLGTTDPAGNPLPADNKLQIWEQYIAKNIEVCP